MVNEVCDVEEREGAGSVVANGMEDPQIQASRVETTIVSVLVSVLRTLGSKTWNVCDRAKAYCSYRPLAPLGQLASSFLLRRLLRARGSFGPIRRRADCEACQVLPQWAEAVGSPKHSVPRYDRMCICHLCGCNRIPTPRFSCWRWMDSG